jgi:hypothetical protein
MLDPWSESRFGLASDHQVEFGDDLAGLDQRWYASFDRRDRDGLRFGEQVPSDCHQARDRSGRRNPLKILRVGLFSPSPVRRPLADDAERASEATRRQPSPEFSTISTARHPLIVEPRQVLIERTLPGPEDIVTFAAGAKDRLRVKGFGWRALTMVAAVTSSPANAKPVGDNKAPIIMIDCAIFIPLYPDISSSRFKRRPSHQLK